MDKNKFIKNTSDDLKEYETKKQRVQLYANT